MSRGSEHMLKSTSGSAIGSSGFSRTSPVEKDLLTHIMISQPVPHRMPRRLVHRDHVHVAGRTALYLRRPAEPRIHRQPQTGQQPGLALHVAAEIDARMLHQVPADAGAVRDHLDAAFRQLGRGPDAGSQQDGRRMECAAADDDFPGPDIDRLAPAADAHPGAARAVEQQLFRRPIPQDPEIRPRADLRRQIGGCGRGAPALPVGRRDREEPVLEDGVVVAQIAPAFVGGRGDEPLVNFGQRSSATRWMAIGPSFPCIRPSLSTSVSILQKNGRTSSQPQPAAPRSTQPS